MKTLDDHAVGDPKPEQELHRAPAKYQAPGVAQALSLRGSVVPERLIDSDEAAAIIGIPPKTLQKMARHGVVRGIRVGKLWRFRASAIDQWIVQQFG